MVAIGGLVSSRKVDRNMVCAFCDNQVCDGPYIEVEVTVPDELPLRRQMFGAHAGCMSRAMVDGVAVEIVDW